MLSRKTKHTVGQVECRYHIGSGSCARVLDQHLNIEGLLLRERTATCQGIVHHFHARRSERDGCDLELYRLHAEPVRLGDFKANNQGAICRAAGGGKRKPNRRRSSFRNHGQRGGPLHRNASGRPGELDLCTQPDAVSEALVAELKHDRRLFVGIQRGIAICFFKRQTSRNNGKQGRLNLFPDVKRIVRADCLGLRVHRTCTDKHRSDEQGSCSEYP